MSKIRMQEITIWEVDIPEELEKDIIEGLGTEWQSIWELEDMYPEKGFIYAKQYDVYHPDPTKDNPTTVILDKNDEIMKTNAV